MRHLILQIMEELELTPAELDPVDDFDFIWDALWRRYGICASGAALMEELTEIHYEGSICTN